MNDSSIQWAINTLVSQAYRLQSDIPDVIQDNPWATVYCFKSVQGLIFLKQVPAKFFLEPDVINLLENEFQANVPFIIAKNQKHHCFLMKDAGIQLHEYFKQNFNMNIFIQTMRTYTDIQIAATDKIQLFFELGVPNWRLENLPLLYQDFINQETLLLDDGLNKNDIIKLKNLQSKLSYLCEKLSSYKIKDSFGHGDFHDKNILINPHTSQTTIIDLGEVVITHPFFSLLNCLHMAKENFSLNDDQYNQILQACLEPWLKMESQENLYNILFIINQCWSIHAVLGEYRLMKSIGKSDFEKLPKVGRFANKLRYWLEQ